MRTLATLLSLTLLAACGGGTAEVGAIGDVGPALADLHLVEDHPQIPAAVFPHAEHTLPAGEGRAASCRDCHHELADHADAVPRACRDCHGYAYLTEPVDESQPHEHAPAPDL